MQRKKLYEAKHRTCTLFNETFSTLVHIRTMNSKETKVYIIQNEIKSLSVFAELTLREKMKLSALTDFNTFQLLENIKLCYKLKAFF